MDIFALSESLAGVGRILAVTGNYASTLKFIRRVDALDVRILAAPSHPACVEFMAIAGAVVQPPIFAALGQTLWESTIQWVFSHFRKDTDAVDAMKEVTLVALKEMGSLARDENERRHDEMLSMIESLRDATRATVKPIGITCEKITIGAVREDAPKSVLDADAKQAIMDEDIATILDAREYEVRLSEIDLQTKHCQVTFSEKDQKRTRGEISDPALGLAGDPYTTAMTERRSLTRTIHETDGCSLAL